MFITGDCVGRCSGGDQVLFSKIYHVLAFLRKVQFSLDRDIKERIWPNCHSMCRSLKIHFGDLVRVIDGHVVGMKHFEVTRSGDVIHIDRRGSFQHSWLVLPDDAIVDPFPTGVYATSPLFFPPFGKYHDVFPASIYIAADGILKNAQTAEVWKKAGNIALVLSLCPEGDDLKEDEVARTVDEAIELVNSFE